MESAKLFGSDDECRSCESGWTMYLVSHSQSHGHGDFYYDDDHHHHHGRRHHHQQHEEGHSDGDSMASDASSGPMEATSRLQLLNQTDDDYGFCLTKKTGKPVMKKKKKKVKKNPKEVKEDMVLTETRVPKVVHNDEDEDEDEDEDDSSDVHSYAGSVKPEGLV